MNETIIHETLQKFGYPDGCIKDYENWAVVLRPKQITLGSLVMISKQDVACVSALSDQSFEEMKHVIKDIEHGLSTLTNYDKINYLTLMMVDPHVHAHVLPRYDSPRKFEGHDFPDNSWPGPPDIKESTNCPDHIFQKLVSTLKECWEYQK